MPAIDLRRYLTTLIAGEGVAGTGDLTVSQRGAGANMSVDIASGLAVIQGDSVSGQGLYAVYNDGLYNLTGFTAAHATNPRVDRVVLRVRDAFHGDAANDIGPLILTGTATAGATLVNLTGAPAVANNQLLLANILVPAGAVSITAANIDATVRPLLLPRMNRPAVRAYHSGTQAAGSGVFTTLVFDSERYDRGNLHGTPTSLLVAPVTGIYSAFANLEFPANATGARALRLRVNGVTVIADDLRTSAGATHATRVGLSTEYLLAAGDYVEALAFQDSGVSLNVGGTTPYQSEFGMALVAA